MIKQLSGMDSMFLYTESHRAPLELSSLQIYDPSTAPDGQVRFKEILATFQSRLDRCPMLRQKLLEVPLSLDHPYWVDDDDFDLEYHVRHISLPKPGDWRQLMTQVARLQARQLDHSKPLWMAHIIEGLENVPDIKRGCFAMFLKIHHAAIDGVIAQEVQNALHDLEPIQADASWYEPSTGPGPQSGSGPWTLLARTPFNTVIKSVFLSMGLARAAPRVIKTGWTARGKGRTPVPTTVFNEGRVSPNRVIDGCFFPLSEMKRIRTAVSGTTINDVALAVVAGGLRRYLDAKDTLPEETLVAGCPVNVGSEQDADQGRGNLLSLMTPPLHTEIADPVERMRAIHEGTEGAKAFMEAFGPRTMTEIPMYLPAPIARSTFPLLAELAVRTKSVPYNTMITNVVGIQKPLYFAGARLLRVMGMGPVIDRAGLFHTVFSYNNIVSITFTACREMLPDPAFYADCIRSSYEELKGATLTGTGATVSTIRKPARKKKASGNRAKRSDVRERAGKKRSKPGSVGKPQKGSTKRAG